MQCEPGLVPLGITASPPGIDLAADPLPSLARRERAGPLILRSANPLSAAARAAKPDELEDSPAAVGNPLREKTSNRPVTSPQRLHMSR